ncbi:FAD:protein FMN transferase [Neisseria dentiae]|uniref:FAD:protein FMN transferase n=1 Tax=Neisseria dentiae TaxID=194197 RepID=UPI00359F91A9
MLQHAKNLIFRLLGLLAVSAALSACGGAPEMATVTGETMGTTYTVKYLANPGSPLPDPKQTQAGFDKILQEVNRQMSTYQTDSEISRFNRMKASEGSMTVSADFATVLAEAVRLNRLTGGALDVTVGPLVNLWGFGPDKNISQAPAAAQISAAEKLVGIDKIRLETKPSETGARLSKQADGVYLDLSAIAKGFGVDKLAQHLDSLGVQNYLVEIGGELRAKGKNQKNEAWSVGIEQPQFAQKQAAQIVVPLNNRSLATSGDYRNFRTDASGKRLSHIIDPQSKQPISHNLASVSVVADNAMTADGLATGLFVMGEEKALATAEKNRLAVFMIIKTADGFKTEMSSAFKEIVK